MFADMKLPASAMSCPVSTLSPLATLATAGAPMCCARGIVTTSGSGSTSIGLAQLSLFSDGWTPPIGNVFIVGIPFLRFFVSSRRGFGLGSRFGLRRSGSRNGFGLRSGGCGFSFRSRFGLRSGGGCRSGLRGFGQRIHADEPDGSRGTFVHTLRQSLHFCGSM